jgi:hypothetical protein
VGRAYACRIAGDSGLSASIVEPIRKSLGRQSLMPDSIAYDLLVRADGDHFVDEQSSAEIDEFIERIARDYSVHRYRAETQASQTTSNS